MHTPIPLPNYVLSNVLIKDSIQIAKPGRLINTPPGSQNFRSLLCLSRIRFHREYSYKIYEYI